MIDYIKRSVKKFDLSLSGKVVLTEAASGNYACTPLIAALAGAYVFAYGRNSHFAPFDTVKQNLSSLCEQLEISDRVHVVNDWNEVPFNRIDVVTNTGFVRPINREFVDRLNSTCVIPLMYEPWELRCSDIDINYCRRKNIKVMGTNEADERLQTMRYIGYTVLYFMLKEKKTPFSTKVLLLGSEKFNAAISEVLGSIGYSVASFTIDTFHRSNNIQQYNVIVLSEFVARNLLMGPSHALINLSELSKSQLVIHIAGNVEVHGIKCPIYPENPAPSNYMSYTTDFIDPIAVIDLHTAGLKVGEGMLRANSLGLVDEAFISFIESNYPALAYHDEQR